MGLGRGDENWFDSDDDYFLADPTGGGTWIKRGEDSPALDDEGLQVPDSPASPEDGLQHAGGSDEAGGPGEPG